ncbi:hypothetical protein [Nonomuraea dietziae]|uniref:hypothetical protein n=1 Tax=Nonomuraea dietziae TaxID=65515 RepID=UPI0033DF38B7
MRSCPPAPGCCLPQQHPQAGRVHLAQIDEDYVGRAHASRGSGHIVVDGADYGQGSSREHAVITPRCLGLRVRGHHRRRGPLTRHPLIRPDRHHRPRSARPVPHPPRHRASDPDRVWQADDLHRRPRRLPATAGIRLPKAPRSIRTRFPPSGCWRPSATGCTGFPAVNASTCAPALTRANSATPWRAAKTITALPGPRRGRLRLTAASDAPTSAATARTCTAAGPPAASSLLDASRISRLASSGWRTCGHAPTLP